MPKGLDTALYITTELLRTSRTTHLISTIDSLTQDAPNPSLSIMPKSNAQNRPQIQDPQSPRMGPRNLPVCVPPDPDPYITGSEPALPIAFPRALTVLQRE